MRLEKHYSKTFDFLIKINMEKPKRKPFITITGITEEEKKTIEEKALKELLTVSAYCRRVLLGVDKS